MSSQARSDYELPSSHQVLYADFEWLHQNGWPDFFAFANTMPLNLVGPRRYLEALRMLQDFRTFGTRLPYISRQEVNDAFGYDWDSRRQQYVPTRPWSYRPTAQACDLLGRQVVAGSYDADHWRREVIQGYAPGQSAVDGYDSTHSPMPRSTALGSGIPGPQVADRNGQYKRAPLSASRPAHMHGSQPTTPGHRSRNWREGRNVQTDVPVSSHIDKLEELGTGVETARLQPNTNRSVPQIESNIKNKQAGSSKKKWKGKRRMMSTSSGNVPMQSPVPTMTPQTSGNKASGQEYGEGGKSQQRKWKGKGILSQEDYTDFTRPDETFKTPSNIPDTTEKGFQRSPPPKENQATLLAQHREALLRRLGIQRVESVNSLQNKNRKGKSVLRERSPSISGTFNTPPIQTNSADTNTSGRPPALRPTGKPHKASLLGTLDEFGNYNPFGTPKARRIKLYSPEENVNKSLSYFPSSNSQSTVGTAQSATKPQSGTGRDTQQSDKGGKPKAQSNTNPLSRTNSIIRISDEENTRYNHPSYTVPARRKSDGASEKSVEGTVTRKRRDSISKDSSIGTDYSKDRSLNRIVEKEEDVERS